MLTTDLVSNLNAVLPLESCSGKSGFCVSFLISVDSGVCDLEVISLVLYANLTVLTMQTFQKMYIYYKVYHITNGHQNDK